VFLLVAGLELVIANFIEPWLYGRPRGDLFPGAAGVGGLLDRSVGTGGADFVYAPDGMRRGSEVLRPQLSFLHVLPGDEPVLAPKPRSTSDYWQWI